MKYRYLALIPTLLTAIAFIACGDDSSNNSSSNANKPDMQVETSDDLPNCSRNREGEIAEVSEERKAYICEDGRWEFDHVILDSVKTEDDLSACLTKNEGDSVWVKKESALFVCIDRKWEKQEKEEETETESIPTYKSEDDLPNCTKDRKGNLALVENDAMLCNDGKWQDLGTVYETGDSVPNCTKKREGEFAFILDEYLALVCNDGKWKEDDEVEEIVVKPEVKSSSSGKSDGKSSSSGKGEAGSSSSGKKETGSSSSSSKKEDSLTSSETIIFETTCGDIPYTVKTAGPNHGWGNFGYVVPLNVKSSKTQDLYLAFDTVYTGIGGPGEWETYGVMISQYDAQKNEWIPGTEIFAKEVKSAKSIDGDNISWANTYGFFEKFSFETKGTWLEEFAEKKVEIVVTFYAPGITSDSSGMGLDYYSIARRDTLTNNALSRLYYSETAIECSLPLKGDLNLSYSCQGEMKKDVYQGDTIALSVMGPVKAMENKSWFSIKSEAGEIVKTEYDTYDMISTIYVTYPTLGKFNEKWTITYLPGRELEVKCRPWYHTAFTSSGDTYTSFSDILEVLAHPVKNCSCTASASKIDVVNEPNGGVASWTLSGCQSRSPITSYEWSGATATTNTTATYAFGGMKGVITPSVKVSNEDGTATTFACPTVTGYDENDPDYVFESSGSSGTINFPAGSHIVEFEVKSQWSSGCMMMCDVKDKSSYKEESVIFNGYEYSGTYNISISLDQSYCQTSSAAQVVFSTDMSCYIY